ncbi:hypothetical protein GOP47_0026678 [Adiantum capillus-veneris]|nr:hypothetical protein GOP47_0026678 [Adiantum capillus-veneris]
MEGRRNMSALQRLVARLPLLNENPTITALLSKGSTLTSEDVLNMCQELFLRPELTVVIAGCFRHLLSRIVKSMVDALRESYAHRTLTEMSDELQECSISTTSWNLCVHEYAVIAFSRVLELAPHLLSSIVEYFLFAPPPFERLLHGVAFADQQKWKSQLSLLDVVRASYRFILLEPSSFESVWDWSPFLDLLLYEGSAEKDVRWCAVQILSLVTRLSDEATRAVSLKISCLTEEEGFSCLLRWEEFCHDIAVEKGGWFVEPYTDMEASSFDSKLMQDDEGHIKWNWDLSGRTSHVDVCGIELPVRKSMIRTGSWPPSFGKSMLATQRLKGNLKALALALSQQEPILLEGCAGSGKTSLIRELGELTGNTDAVFIHLNEQVDGKTLLGTYVCADIPGEFRWQPGAITQAVLQGLWLVLEDVDKAPSEVLSALAPLLESRKIYIPGRAETVKAAATFQLFATVTRTDGVSASHSAARDILNNLWRRVVVVPPNDTELESIMAVLFPSLRPLVPKLTETLKLIDAFSSQASSRVDAFRTRIFFGRRFSLRDLLKWCKRLKSVKEIGSAVQPGSIREIIFREAVDCFAGCISDCKSRRLVMNGIAKLWEIAEEQVNFFEMLNKPTLQIISGAVQVGRACLSVDHPKAKMRSGRPFAYTGHAMRNLERIAVCVQQREPVLLVGETGTGKTTLVQHLADQVAMPLIVMNLSQQSDSADLIGGFKPVEAQQVCVKLVKRFKELFCRTFPSQHNSEYLTRVHQFAEKRKLKQLLKAFRTAVAKVESLTRPSSMSNAEVGAAALGEDQPRAKRKRPLTNELRDGWDKFFSELGKCEQQVLAAENSFAFAFIEGALVRALKHGHWILLDELNLAPVETLERLTGVLEGENGSLNLTERGDIKAIQRHPNFRVFACMNPATDVGKHDLPMCLKSRFTEFYVDEIRGADDLQLFVFRYLEGLMPNPPVAAIVDFYQQALLEAEVRLYDSANQKPRYSLRSLARALEYTQVAMPLYGFVRALFDGVCMTFLTLLDRPSSALMENLIQTHLIKKLGPDLTKKDLLARGPGQPSDNHIEFEHFWLERGNFNPSVSSLEFTRRYVLTKTIKEHLKNVAKAVFIRKYPVLLQGPTSSGKTSSIEYLATITNHRFVRINNHEHTDLQEYLGTYVTSPQGKLVFQEGILVEAVRNGYWVVLDELNLAPSEVLEALNRLLDDNRELFIPELQLVIKPHPHFMLFATQNPPGLYGGRKVLSRAFRNRFLELHVDDIPEDELCIILEQRCEIPKSYAEKMIAVMKDLQRNRQASQAFAGKHGFITARDLFKWADRHRKSGVSYEDLARIGYVLLAERLRDANEKIIVRTCLEKNLRTKINMETLYSQLSVQSHIQEVKRHLVSKAGAMNFGKIVWTKSMTRLFSLVEQCYQHKEPVLLIGETGCGKTTVCQLLSVVHERCLRIVNCHQHTETSDFLGGFRPVRERESIVAQFEQMLGKINSSELFRVYCSDELPHSIEFAEDTMKSIRKVIRTAKSMGQYDGEEMEVLDLEQSLQELERLKSDYQALFVWQDGPLVEAMRRGNFFLVDEISLAEDSVLERLNSVLEAKRLLVLAEKGGSNVEELSAHPDFFLMATMNPGGDFGKKELSPALRNRFTEIWVPPIIEEDDLRSIIHTRFLDHIQPVLTDPLLNFWKWYQEQDIRRGLTVRDLLSWIHFVNTVGGEIGKICACIHGAFLVLLDGISLGLSNESVRSLRKQCLDFLLQQLPADEQLTSEDFNDNTMMTGKHFMLSENKVGVHPFFISKGPMKPKEITFELMAPTTSINTFRILRAMQLPKPVLIEGSPGVGKTSLITAISNISGHSLVRINLSEQTDMMDLLGSDLPVEGDGADFRWSDGVFLQALKVGSWVLLDELNLASQSVLEGLNACLDHRGEVFIPELGRSFKCHPSFRIFACQNPALQGGGRKSLPRSFLNRFTKVYVDTLSEEDFLFISRSLHPSLSQEFLTNLIQFNTRILKDTMVTRSYGHLGAPWEFNLRDVLRSCALVEGGNQTNFQFLEIVYLQRMRTARDRCCVLKLYEEVFGSHARLEAYPRISLDRKALRVGNVMLPRSTGPQSWTRMEDLTFLPGQIKSLESLLLCVKNGWMSILVGPAGCGKTALVRLLAHLTGTPLQEFALSSGTDTTDLLGCFEQYDVLRCWQQLAKKVGHLVQVAFVQCFIALDKTLPASKLVSLLRNMLTDWSNFEKSLNLRTEGSSGNYANGNMGRTVPDLVEINLLLQVVGQVKFVSSLFEESLVNLSLEVEAVENDLLGLKRKVSSKFNRSHFEWVDGGFLRAVERGDWVLLENANTCSPTVLDRLNPLLEPNGAILVNERGLTSESATVLRAHPNFRLFLTVNPCHGEVSRAMRNRGVEIHLMQPHTWIDNVNCFLGQEEQTKNAGDSRQYLIHAGIPSVPLVDAMCHAHIDASRISDASALDYSACIRELRQWMNLFWQLLNRGFSLSESLFCSWDQTYVHGYADYRKGGVVADVSKRHFTQSTYAAMVQSSSTLQLPGGWPRPLSASNFCRMSIEAVAMRDCMYLEHLLGEQAAFQVRSAWCSVDTNERENLFKWMQNQKDAAVVFPGPLFQLLLHPSSSKSLVFVERSVPDSKILDKMVMYASLWIMRGVCSSLTREMRYMWMKWKADQAGPHRNSLKLFCKIIEQESGHPVYKQAMESLIHFTAIEDDQLDKLDALRRTLLQWQIEDDWFEKSHQNLHRKPESLIIKSFKCYAGQSKDYVMEMEWNDSALAAYPLLLFVRGLEEEVLSCRHSEWSKETCKTYFKLLDSHKALWKAACEVFIESDVYSESHGLYLCWKTLRGSIIQLISDFSSEKVAAKFRQTVQKIEKMFSAKKRVLKLYVWKHSGHPLIPSTKEAFKELQALLSFCYWLWPDNAHGEADFISISSSEVFRRLALEGIGMAMSVVQGLWKDKEDTSVQRGGELVASDILKKLCDLVNAQSLQKSFPTDFLRVPGCKCFPLHLVQDSCYREALLQGCRHSNWLVLPWLDSFSLIQDSTVLATVTQIASRLTCDGGHDTFPKELVDAKEQLLGVIDFSLKFSSRSPLDLVPHQQTVWLINAISVDGHFNRTFVKEFQSFCHQVRFNWYSAVFQREPRDDLGSSLSARCTGAGLLFNASNSVEISRLITQVVPLKQLNSKIMELRLATKVLWGYRNERLQHSTKTDFLDASATLYQLICSFTKTFKRDDAAQIHSLLGYLHTKVVQGDRGKLEDEIQRLKAFLKKSSDKRFVTFIDSHVSLCLDWLYCQSGRESSSTGIRSLYGRVWLLVGATRLNLVLPSRVYDPAAKYAVVRSVLLEKHSEARLELQVREENDLIVRGGTTSEDNQRLKINIQELEEEINSAASKCVYRQQAENLGLLYNEITCFIKSMDGSQSVFAWIRALDTDVKNHSVDQVIQELLQWQDVSMEFIQRVLSNYPDYKDLTQPVLLAVFEIKMGLAMLFAAFQEKNLVWQRGLNVHPSDFYEFICGLMEFPTSSTTTFRNATATATTPVPVLYFLREGFTESMVAVIGLQNQEKEIVKLKAKVFKCAILHVRKMLLDGGLAAGSVSEIIGMLLTIVSEFWSVTRNKLDAKRSEEISLIQIKHQSHNLGLDLDQDEEGFTTIFPEHLRTSGFATEDSDELGTHASAEDVAIDAATTQVSEQDWKVHECLLGKELTDLLNLIFGLQSAPEIDSTIRTVSEEQRLAVFTSSYETGTTYLEGVGEFLPPSLNERLIPAHMLMLSLKEESLSSTNEKRQNFNIYEDSSPSQLACLLNSLEVLQEHIMKLLGEWPNQPSLVQLMRGLEALLSMPVDVPLVKALTGVEQLLSKAQLWEANAPKNFSLQDVLGPLQYLVSKWRRFELEYWEVLLQKVELQFDQEADKLWFSLYGVLHPKTKIDFDSDLEPIIASLEEFMQTAPLGEYKRRLQMLTGFYAEFCIQTHLSEEAANFSRLSKVISKVLFNISGYYTQFAPLIENSVTATRNNVSKELKDFLKLHKWDERSYYALTSSTESTHRKLFKFVSKYKGFLRKPALASVIDRNHLWSSVQGLKNEQMPSNEGVTSCKEDSNVADCTRYLHETWLPILQTKAQDLISLACSATKEGAEIVGSYKDLPSLLPRFWGLLNSSAFSERVTQARQRGTDVLEDLATTVIARSYELREGEKKRNVKHKALVDLLKFLRSLGFSRHRSAIPKEERSPKSWILQAPCKVDCFLNFLMIECRTSSIDATIVANKHLETVSGLWNKACDYYFKNLALIQQLRQLSLNFHRDLTLQEVAASISYLEHGLYMQQTQRCFAHDFAFKLVSLQSIVHELGIFVCSRDSENHDGKIISHTPDFERKWLWIQKGLLDSLYNTLLETSLLYKKAAVMQSCPCDCSSSSGLEVIINGLETLAESLSACKRNLDELLVPGIYLFAADEIESSWPALISPNAIKILRDSFAAVSSVKSSLEILFRQADHGYSGSRPLWELCCKASIMFQEYEEQCKERSSGIEMDYALLEDAYKTQRNQLITEVLLSVQELTRVSSQIKTDSVSDEHFIHVGEREKITIESQKVLSLTSFMKEQMSSLRLEKLYQAALATILLGVRQSGSKDVATQNNLWKDFSIIAKILELLVATGFTVFVDYVMLHKSLAKLSYVLGNLFEELFQEGFCKTQAEAEQELASNVQEACGTGMGEGQGKTDVSDQIEDENQLLGSSEKDLQEDRAREDKDMCAEKGIEMAEDFEGDLMDISGSESEGSEQDDDEDVQLESEMGEGGENQNIVDESLWNKDDAEEVGGDRVEKYETGSSVKETCSDLEFRAKEKDAYGSEDEGKVEQSQKDSKVSDEPDQVDEDFDSTLEKRDAYEAPSGIDPSVDADVDETKTEVEDPDDFDDFPFENINESMENMDVNDDVSETEEAGGQEQEPPSMAVDGETGADAEETKQESIADESSEGNQEPHVNQNLEHPSNLVSDNGLSQGMSAAADLPDPISGQQRSFDALSSLPHTASMELASLEEVPSEPVNGPNMTPSNSQMGLSDGTGQQKQSKGFDSHGKEDNLQNLDRLDANPYRSLGDILKQWKERVTVKDESSIETEGAEKFGEELEIEGSEYQYVNEDRDIGPQALGSATFDQMNQSKVSEMDFEQNILNDDVAVPLGNTKSQKEEENLKDINEISRERSQYDSIREDEDDDIDTQHALKDAGLDLEMHEVLFKNGEIHTGDRSYVSTKLDQTVNDNSAIDLVSKNLQYTSEDVHRIRKELENALNMDSQSIEKARLLWAMYEQLTTRLSQELTEQLRLIMEPTLASRLEGDYRTGKRINLKKVIPYIASQFRRDKIWLRRTKPSKRQYQVVLAIDDSRSMSESHCGHLALEALVTICRSMSTLEVGQMAVASFGQKGNVKILHDFDSPFTAEAGIRMISQFSFKQDNTIADEPMVDLLHYLTCMLDVVAKNTSTSGRQQLRQLVLIIADGRFHEKETLRRCIREAISRGQMLAFIVLDSTQESIMDVQSVSFSGGAPTFSKYIDTFPFPYYILLKNIEELPRTLVDLLRQWFEMVQRARLQ